MNKKRLRIIIIVIIGVTLFGFLYFSFFGSKESESQLLVNIDVDDPAFFVGGSELLPFVLKLRNIDFDTEVLSSASFASLSDLSVSLQPQPLGRVNPFAPIGTDNSPIVIVPEEEESEF